MRYLFLLPVLLATRIAAAQQADVTAIDSVVSRTNTELEMEQLRRPDIAELPVDTGGQSVRSVTVRSRLDMNLLRAAGYEDGSYLGSPLHSYQRVLLRFGSRWRGGFLVEKDAAERSFSDFLAYHCAVESVGILTRAVVGDFRVESGEGLLLASGYGASSGADILLPFRRPRMGLSTFLSADEVHYLSGAAMEISALQSSWRLFVSRRTYAATLDTAGAIRSIGETGLFQTPSSLKNRDNAVEFLTGIQAEWNPSPPLRFTVAWTHAQWSRPGAGGRRLDGQAVAISYTCSFPLWSVRGEWARSGGGGGILNLVQLAPDRSVRCIFAWRYYGARFGALHGAGMSQSAASVNEEGLSFGIECAPSRTLRIHLWHDRSAPVTLPAGDLALDRRGEFLGSISWHPWRRFGCELIVRREEEQAGGSLPVRDRLRLRLTHTIASGLTFSAEPMLSVIHPRDGAGWCTGRVITGAARGRLGSGLEADLRLSLFSANAYETRMAIYEPGPEGSVSFPFVYGEGARWSLLVRHRITAAIAWTIRISDVIRDDLRRIGSGSAALEGNHQTSVSCQIDASFPP